MVYQVIKSAAREARVEFSSAFDDPAHILTPEFFLSEIARAGLIVALLLDSNPDVYYEIGLAQAIGKPVILVADEDTRPSQIVALQYSYLIKYRRSEPERLRHDMRSIFSNFRRDRSRYKGVFQPVSRAAILPVVDLDRLEPRDFENLCFELLTQIGFKRVEWDKRLKEIDVVATLSKKDPDGFDYNELWLISTGPHVPVEIFFEMAQDSDYLLHRLKDLDLNPFRKDSDYSDMPITLLLIMYRGGPQSDIFRRRLKHAEFSALNSSSPGQQNSLSNLGSTTSSKLDFSSIHK